MSERHMKKIVKDAAVAALFAVGLLVGIWCPYQRECATAAMMGAFAYDTAKGTTGTTERFSDAFDICRRYGGCVTVQNNYVLNAESYDKYIYVPKNVKLLIPDRTELVLGEVDLWLDGTMQVQGVLDLSRAGGTICGDGEMVVAHGGEVRKRAPHIEKSGEICLVGSDIRKGQPLSASQIENTRILWNALVEGNWSFAEGNYVPGGGTALYDVTFTPKNEWTYQSMTFPACGKVTVIDDSSPADTASGPESGMGTLPKPGISTVDAKNMGTYGDMGVGDSGFSPSHPVIVTRMVSTPSTIYTAVKSFAQKRPSLKKLSRAKNGKKVKLTWTDVAGATAYEVQYARYRSMKGAKKIPMGKPLLSRQRGKEKSLIIYKLGKKKKYYFRVRAYKVKNKKRTYSKWSSVKKA